MKKNLILLGILILLLVTTYFVQEKRAEREYQESFTEGRLIQEEITHLKLPYVEAEKISGQWRAGPQLLSHNQFRQIEKQLREIKETKKIQGEWKSFFTQPLNFEVNHIPWAIGDMSLDRKEFYVSKSGVVYLAILDGGSPELVHDETHLEESKLQSLRTELSRPLGELLEKQLFRFYPGLEIDRVAVKSEGNLDFELNFLTNTTEPPPIPGISVHQELKTKFQSLLTQINIRKEIPYQEKLKFKKLGQVHFFSPGGKDLLWELWLQGKDSGDAVILDAQNKRAFLMTGGTLKLFFTHLQDYWDKKIIPPHEFKHFTELPIILSQGSKEATVTVYNREPLDFSVRGFKPKRGNLGDLFQLIFNLDRLDQADRVSLLNQGERKQVLSENLLRVKVMGQELVLWSKPQELIVVNLTQGFKSHFMISQENFHPRFEDMLE